MGLKSVPKNKKPTTTQPPPPPPPTHSPSASDDDTDNNTAVSATSSSATSSSNSDIPSATPTVPTPAKNPTPSSSEVESDDGDDDDDSPPTEQTPSSKPVTSSKRPAESETVSGSEKRPKKDVSTALGPSVAVAATPQKQLFQRLFSDEDEIVILKGIVDYKAKKGIDPMTNIDDFLSFVKKSLVVVDVNKRQLKDKIVRLKKRFLNAQKKKLSDPHEINIFEVSKKIWGGLLADCNDDDSVDYDDDDVKKGSNGTVDVKKGKEVKRSEVREVEGKGKGKGSLGSLEFGFFGEDGVVLSEMMRSLGEGERGEVKKMVKKANEAYLEAYLLRLKVLEVAAKKMLDGFRKD